MGTLAANLGDRDAWGQLLARLDRDPRCAARSYEELRRRLIAFFRARGVCMPEDLADEVFDRTAKKLARGVRIDGDIAGYLLGVGRRIVFEAHRRSRKVAPLDPELASAAPPVSRDEDLARLSDCLARLPHDERAILLAYEEGNGGERIHVRKQLAAQLGIPLNALRIRIHRLRARLGTMMRAAAS
jgi:DNA-directed RNA polymerase specialized sigma24 family protein